jgi:uncharacterized membrane protein YoaT (DUF817 family)
MFIGRLYYTYTYRVVHVFVIQPVRRFVVDIVTYPCYNGSVRQVIVRVILSLFFSAAEHVIFGDIAMSERPMREVAAKHS